MTTIREPAARHEHPPDFCGFVFLLTIAACAVKYVAMMEVLNSYLQVLFFGDGIALRDHTQSEFITNWVIIVTGILSGAFLWLRWWLGMLLGMIYMLSVSFWIVLQVEAIQIVTSEQLGSAVQINQFSSDTLFGIFVHAVCVLAFLAAYVGFTKWYIARAKEKSEASPS